MVNSNKVIPPLFILIIFAVTTIKCEAVKRLSKLEEQQYETLQKQNDIQIRQYKSSLQALVTINGEQKRALQEGFAILSNYRNGANRRKVKAPKLGPQANKSSEMTTDESLYRCENIPMRVPILQFSTRNYKWTIAMYMPSYYQLDTLPIPDNEHIKLLLNPAQKFAVISISDYGSKKNLENKLVELKTFLSANKIIAEDKQIFAYYNLALPFLHRTELMIPIAD